MGKTESVNKNENKENKKVEEFQKYVLQQKPTNTKVKTQSDMKAWKRFCLQKDKNRELCEIPADELNLVLCKFFKTVKKLDGAQYEPVSLTCFQRSVQRSLNERGSDMKIIDGGKFKLSREVLSAKRRQIFVEHGKGNKPNAVRELTEGEEDKLFGCSEFGTSNPTVLQRTLWWIIALHFAFRGQDESRRLKWGDVTLEKIQKQRMTFLCKDMSGGQKRVKVKTIKPYAVRAFHPTAQATGT